MARCAANTSRRTGLTEPPHRMGCRADTRPSKRVQPQQSSEWPRYCSASALWKENRTPTSRSLSQNGRRRLKYNCATWTVAENQREQAKAAWRFPREAGTE